MPAPHKCTGQRCGQGHDTTLDDAARSRQWFVGPRFCLASLIDLLSRELRAGSGHTGYSRLLSRHLGALSHSLVAKRIA